MVENKYHSRKCLTKKGGVVMRRNVTVLLVLCFFVFLSLSYATDWEFQRVVFKHPAEAGGVGGGFHGVVVDPDGKLWIISYKDPSIEIIVNYDNPYLGDDAAPDTGQACPVYIVDPVTGEQVDFSPLYILTMPDGSYDTLWTGSLWNGKGRGISKDRDGNILISSWATIYRIDYKTGNCLNRFIPESAGLPMSSLTEAVQDVDNGLIFCSYVIGSSRPIFMLDDDFNYIGNAADTLGHIDRSLTVTKDGMDLYVGSTWNGMGIEHWHSDLPGVLAYTQVDTFANFDSIRVDSIYNTATGEWEQVEPYYLYDVKMWVESLDWGPDSMLYAGESYVDYSTPATGGRFWIVDPKTKKIVGSFGKPIGNLENEAALNNGGFITPRGVDFSADGQKMYACDFDGAQITEWVKSTGSIEESENVKKGFRLEQNYPNPFNSITVIPFYVEKKQRVKLTVYDMLGRNVFELFDKVVDPGYHRVYFKADGIPAGTYIYKLEVGNFVETKKMLYLK